MPSAPEHLFYEDSINFAQAVNRYDPRHLVPQPPGYPLFVLQAKVLRAITGSVERSFSTGVVLATALAFFFLLLLGREIFGGWLAAAAGALLLALNPVFIFTGFTSPIRVYLAAVSTVVAVCCWHAWNGDRRYAWAAAVALGLGSGYRPELLALLFPLWAVSVWRASGSVKRFAAVAAVLAAISALWIGSLLSRFPDLHAFRETFIKYLADQSRDTSPLYGAAAAGWVRMLFRVAMWNATAMVGWLVLAPLARPLFTGGVWWFVGLWVAPSMVFHALVHVEAADQTLATIPAFCLMGGAVLVSFYRRNRDVGAIGIAFAVAANLAVFLAPFPLRPLPAFYKPAVDALWQTSWRAQADVQAQSETVLAALRQFAHESGTLVMWNRSPVTWRALSYYLPDTTFCLLLDDRRTGNRPHAALWRNLELRERFFGDPPTVPLGDADGIVWVLGNLSPVRAALAHRLLPRAEGVYWTAAEPMELPGYRIVR